MRRSEFLCAGVLAPLLIADSNAESESQIGDLDGFIELFYRQKRVREAFERYVTERYVQHSVGMAQGREAAIAVLEPMFARENFLIDPVRVFQNADLLAVILDVRVGDSVRAMVVDIFRHSHGKVLEHWDVKFEIPAEQRDHYFDGMKPRDIP
jgi:predicted SnoaL-like aldol condensation-catalyzing enzyme